MIPSVLASAQIVAGYAAVVPVRIDPATAPRPFTAAAVQVPPAPKPKVEITKDGYFDAGYEKLIGVFTDQVLRIGVRYGQDELNGYAKNQTIDTHGSGLPFPQAITGTSVGLEYRHWFPKNQMFAFFSMGTGVSGFNQGKTDTRYGLIGYSNWMNGRWLSDVYGELVYVALVPDTFADIRFRAGKKLYMDSKGNYVWLYMVGQGWVSGQATSGTENRFEAGPGLAYLYRKWNLSINIEPRVGYSFRGPIPEQLYFNPTIIITAGFDIKN